MKRETGEQEFNTYGFDAFFGKTNEPVLNYIWLDMKNFGRLQAGKLEMLFPFFCNFVRDGSKVLLTKSPGKITGLREVLVGNAVDIINKEASGDPDYPVRKNWVVQESIPLFTLSPDELKRLEEMYEKRVDLKLYPNPFCYQPEQ